MLMDVEYYKAKLKEKYATVDDPEVEERYLHSLAVGRKALELIKRFGFDVDIKKAEIAGIIHDYAKFEKMDKYREIVEKYHLDPSALNIHHKLLHSYLGPYIIQDELGLDDVEILNAVRNHTTGSLDMDKLSEVLYLADFIDDTRSGEYFEEAKQLALIDFNAAICAKIKKLMIKNNNELNKKLLQKYGG